ncbi:hypothetical protein M5689_020574 [Euphorbia peplus]|nr:hypothetical protein M5689_020574 [Euphorbia peplus]
MRGKRNESAKTPHGDDESIGITHETKEGAMQEDPDLVTLPDSVLHDNDVVYNCDFMFQNDVFTSKHDAMKSQFAYLCDLSEDGTMHSLDHLTSAFSIHNTALHHVNLGTKDEPRLVPISPDLSPAEHSQIEAVLRRHQKVFAWLYEDMPGVEPSIAEHAIPLKLGAVPIRQKLRRLRPEWAQLVKDEITKQIKSKFLEVVDYAEWVANVVPVGKKDGKVRVCGLSGPQPGMSKRQFSATTH